MRGELYIKAVACAALLGIVGMGCKSNDNAGLTSIPSFAGSGNNPGGGNPNTGPGNGNDTGGLPGGNPNGNGPNITGADNGDPNTPGPLAGRRLHQTPLRGINMGLWYN